MAGPLMSSGGSGRRSRRGATRPMADINVTPMVDVMLVLLVVFMVTAPLLTVSVPVDLPKTQGQSTPHKDKEPLIISINSKSQVFLQETQIDLPNLVQKLKSITGSDPSSRIFVRGDQSIAYGRIMEVMGTISAAGFSKVALVAELPKPAPVRTRPQR